MTDNDQLLWAPGTPEYAEWQEIAAAPAWHQRPVEVRRARLEQMRHQQAVLSPAEEADELQAAARLEDELRRLSAAGVLFGPDVSQYQGLPAWATVKAAGCRLKFWKATEGRTFKCPSAAHNAAPLAGMVDCAYHFLYFSQEYADRPALWGAQADWFARNVTAGVGHVLDVEAAATPGHWLGVKEWAAEYRRLFPGHPLGGYLNRSLWRNRSRMPYDPAGIFDYVWHAGIGDGYYTSATGSIAAEWGAVGSLSNSVAGMGFPTVRLWQITDHAAVPGVSGTCDGNAWQGTAADLAAMLTGTRGDDSMSAADVAALKAYIDSKLADLPPAVWRVPVGGETDPNGHAVTQGIASQRNYNRIADVQAKVTAQTSALVKVLAQTDTLEAVNAAQTAALALINRDALAESIAAKLGGSADAAIVKAAVTEALHEELPGVHLAIEGGPA